MIDFNHTKAASTMSAPLFDFLFLFRLIGGFLFYFLYRETEDFEETDGSFSFWTFCDDGCCETENIFEFFIGSFREDCMLFDTDCVSANTVSGAA